MLFCALLSIFIGIIPCAMTEPACTKSPTVSPRYEHFTCSGFDDPENLYNAVPRESDSSETKLVLRDVTLDYFLPQTFARTNASRLTLSNVTVGTYVRGWLQRYYAFEGLEDSLEVFELADNSSYPSSWTLLSDMRSLKELRLVKLTGLRLSSNFAQLPRSVGHVAVIRSTIESVDAKWLASLTNLERVSVIRCNLLSFSRTMLPRPAPKLWRLILDYAELTSLPEDFAEELPALRELGLRHNSITSFRAATFLPLAQNGTRISLAGNPLDCTCEAAFLLDLPYDWHYPSCATPVSLVNKSIRELTPAQLNCGGGASDPFEYARYVENNETF